MNLLKYIKILVIVSVFPIVSSCDLDGGNVCEDSSMNQIHVSFNARVIASYSDSSPLNGAAVQISFQKSPCGQEDKGHASFSGFTNAGGYISPVVGYNLQNKEDLVIVQVSIDNGIEDFVQQTELRGEDLIPNNGNQIPVNFYFGEFTN